LREPDVIIERETSVDCGEHHSPSRHAHARPEVALVTNFVPHYRRPLFVELGQRLRLTLVLTSRGDEWYWQGDRPFDAGGVPVVRASEARAVTRALRARRYDVVVASLTGRSTLLAAVLSARRLHVPFVLWTGIWEHPRTAVHKLSRPFVRRLYRSADAVLTYGQHVSEHVARESGRTDNVFVACQAVENERLRREVPAARVRALREHLDLDGLPVFVFVGRLTEEKGLGSLLEASALARSPHRLVIAGAGPLLEAAKARAAALGIQERVRFAGRVEQTELPALLRAGDALVLPSVATRRMREPWGLVVNEAMNCNLPVVATDSVGAAAGGLVVHGSTGLVVRERDPVALAHAIDRLAASPEERARLGRAGSERVLTWNYETAADAFEQALAIAAEGRP
jgi:glycosyltransferase involved in cell wall biosynthesis